VYSFRGLPTNLNHQDTESQHPSTSPDNRQVGHGTHDPLYCRVGTKVAHVGLFVAFPKDLPYEAHARQGRSPEQVRYNLVAWDKGGKLIGVRTQANPTMVPPEVRHQDSGAYPQCFRCTHQSGLHVYFDNSTTLKGVTGGGQNSISRRTELLLPFSEFLGFPWPRRVR